MLNLNQQSSGDFTPWVKYNAKAGRWYIKGELGDKEVQNPTFVADFENIKTGWLLFLEGQAPSRVWDESLVNMAPQPSEKHKRGFSLDIFSNQSFGGVVELSSSSMHLCSAIQDLYKIYSEDKDKHKGQLPVVQFTGATPMKDKMGTNYRPDFKVIKWTDRQTELSGAAAVATNVPEQPKTAAASASEF